MKFYKSIMVAVIAASAMIANTSRASVIDIVDSGSDIAVTVGSPVELTHNLFDHDFVLNFTHYTSGTIKIRLTDEVANEDGNIKFAGQTITSGDVDNNSVNLPLPHGTVFNATLLQAALDELNNTGKLVFTVTSTNKAFYFSDSELTLSEAAVVPEPVSLSLFAVGLIGVAAMRRRKAVA